VAPLSDYFDLLAPAARSRGLDLAVDFASDAIYFLKNDKRVGLAATRRELETNDYKRFWRDRLLAAEAA
jgi:hypothetical protein